MSIYVYLILNEQAVYLLKLGRQGDNILENLIRLGSHGIGHSVILFDWMRSLKAKWGGENFHLGPMVEGTKSEHKILAIVFRFNLEMSRGNVWNKKEFNKSGINVSQQ